MKNKIDRYLRYLLGLYFFYLLIVSFCVLTVICVYAIVSFPYNLYLFALVLFFSALFFVNRMLTNLKVDKNITDIVNSDLLHRHPQHPPKEADVVLHLLLNDEMDGFFGDLNESFVKIAKDHGKRTADIWYREQVFSSVIPLVKWRMRFPASTKRRPKVVKESVEGTSLPKLKIHLS